MAKTHKSGLGGSGSPFVNTPSPLQPPNTPQGVPGTGSILQGLSGTPQNDPTLPDQTPTPQNTPVTPDAAAELTKMTDDELVALYNAARKATLPNHLSDVRDITQQFVYAAGVNAKPTVLDAAEYAQFMKDNNISASEQLSRSFGGGQYTQGSVQYNITPQMVGNMFMYSQLNYIGGKQGGQALGAGAYFDMNGGRNTGYGGTTIVGVLDPKRARVIDTSQLSGKVMQFARTHPKFYRAMGGYDTSFSGGDNNQSIWALVLGYNVITNRRGYGGYHNVIDRSALVIRK